MVNLTRESARHIANLARPHYVFRPVQMLRRVSSIRQLSGPERRFRLVWGPEITASLDPVGVALLRRGIFDLVVCETLLRLADPGETVLDVGANIGHMTSLLAHAVGEQGRVIAFEPHPEVFAQLTRNVTNWRTLAETPSIELNQVGLSAVDGAATLSTDVFQINQGSASLEPPTQRRGTTDERQGTTDEHSVRVQRLDTALGTECAVGVMKIDIEGHEIHALEGAGAMLSAGRIRDIVFEENKMPPTAVTRLLEGYGFTVLRLGERLRGPVLGPLDARDVRTEDDPSLLATRAPVRAVERMRPRGWAIYGVGPAARIERDRRRPAGSAPRLT